MKRFIVEFQFPHRTLQRQEARFTVGVKAPTWMEAITCAEADLGMSALDSAPRRMRVVCSAYEVKAP